MRPVISVSSSLCFEPAVCPCVTVLPLSCVKRLLNLVKRQSGVCADTNEPPCVACGSFNPWRGLALPQLRSFAR
jgi:hypothetical protein